MCSIFCKIESVSARTTDTLGLEIRKNKTTMASSKEDGTAAAAQQLGSMSLGDSVERKNNETEPTTKNGTTPTKLFCSACGKKSDALKKCTACKCVWYCDKKCQNKHWKEHKKECRPIKKELDKRGGKLDLGEELAIGPLGKLPPREECPICMHALPIHESLHTYFPCCGKMICCGCDHQHSMKSGKGRTCAFCREPLKTDDENLARLSKRIELNDPVAMCNMALAHGFGFIGLPVDRAKCIGLLRQSADDLGDPTALNQLGNFYHDGTMGLEQNDGEALKYWEKAAKSGHLVAQHNLGFREVRIGDNVAAIRHWRLSASGGLRMSMENLIAGFENGFLHHGDLAETLQAMYRSKAEMKSDDRNKYIQHLKTTGKYKQEYDM